MLLQIGAKYVFRRLVHISMTHIVRMNMNLAEPCYFLNSRLLRILIINESMRTGE